MLSFSSFPLNPDIYSRLPFQILGAEQRNAFALLMEIILLETGDRQARANWQSAQLRNLLQHAAGRSQFWRERIGKKIGKGASPVALSRLPLMTRTDLNRQLATEGALLDERKDGVKLEKRATSGSTGTPASFFVSHSNTVYNEARNFARYFMEGIDLRLNLCRFKADPLKPGYTYREGESYAGIFSSLFSTGKTVEIGYLGADLELIIRRMKSYGPHFLVCLPPLLDTMAHNFGPAIFKEADVRLFIPYGNAVSPEMRRISQELAIPIRSSYSCEEVGPIGFECPENPDSYHVAESNVIVELGEQRIEHEGRVCRNLLLTGLHSYATPFLRYEVGDFASLAEECPCGHQGRIIHKLLGRLSTTLKLPDGRRRPFNLMGRVLLGIVDYEDLKIRQTALDTITVDIVSKDRSEEARRRLVDYLQTICGLEFSINVAYRDRIDWGPSPKRLAFLCEV
jgi:phenylacetate-coenzyme A ligase PaaK-like adenylate-forming protein